MRWSAFFVRCSPVPWTGCNLAVLGTVWEATAAPRQPRAALGLTDHEAVDVAVVGAGFTGLWSAYHLLQADPSLSVLVIDAGHVGFGASGRNGGWCSALFPVSTAGLVNRHGHEQASAMRAACRQAVDDVLAVAAREGIEIGAAKGGTVVVARNAAGVASAEAEVAESARLGLDRLDLLSAVETAERVGAQGVRAATYTPDCARLHPVKLVQGLAETVEARGGRIVEDTRVIAVEPGRVRTTRGDVRARSIVRATEGFTPTIAGAARDIVPVYSLVLATPVLPAHVWSEIGLDRGETFSEQQHLVVYGQRTADDRLVFGGRGAPYHWGSTIAPRFDRVGSVHRALARNLLSLFPVLRNRSGPARIEGLPVQFTWGGALGIPRDWHPSVTFDERTRVATAGGYVGDGVALTHLAGATIGDLLLGRSSERTRLPWVNHRSPRWEPEPWRWLGVNAGLRLAKAADATETISGRPGLLSHALSALTGGGH